MKPRTELKKSETGGNREEDFWEFAGKLGTGSFPTSVPVDL